MKPQRQHPNPWVASAQAAGAAAARPRSSPTFVNELLAARESLALNDELVMAIRSQRARRGLSQRAYAAVRGWSAARVARLETRPTQFSINDVMEALSGSDYTLVLAHVSPAPAHSGRPHLEPLRGHTAVSPTHWSAAQLLARTIDNKRFPAHRAARRTDDPAWYRRHFLTWMSWQEGPWWTTERPSI